MSRAISISAVTKAGYGFPVAMGRCQSTPGLVESRGRVSLEDMWISPIDLKSTHPYSTAASLFSPSPSPVTARPVPSAGILVDANNAPRGTESPISGASSGPSSEDQTARAPPSAATITQASTGRQSTHSGEFPLYIHPRCARKPYPFSEFYLR